VLNNRLLLTLISSSAFKAYFDMLQHIYGLMMLPSHRQRPLYDQFERTLRGKGQEEEQEEQEQEEQEEEQGPEDPGFTSFLRFLRSLVVHFTAKRTLERHCFRTKDQEVNLSLFHVGRTSLAIPAGSWSTLECLLNESYSPKSSLTSTAEAIEILKGKVLNRSLTTQQQNSQIGSILGKFQLVMEDKEPLLLSGGLHCETVLATLGKYFESILQGDDKANLTSICKVLLPFTASTPSI
jgi:hypothetical protein